MSETRYLILCAGVGYRWHDYLGIRKHQLPLDGEAIINRTVGQLNRLGITPYIVAPVLPAYAIEGSILYTPVSYRDTEVQVDKFLSSEPIWNTDGPTVWMWGDVWWSDKAIWTMANYSGGDDFHVWYRPGKSEITGCGYGEMFAHRFNANMHQAERDACARIIDLHRRELIPWLNTGGWALYRAMLGLPDEQVHGWTDGRNVTVIDDWTDDFDHPMDYVSWYGNRAKWRYRMEFNFLSTRPDIQEKWPASDPDPEVLFTVTGNVTIPGEQMWCAAAHAMEWRQGVFPYSHPVPAGAPWVAEPIWTAKKHEKRIIAHPLESGPRNGFIRLQGPMWEWK